VAAPGPAVWPRVSAATDEYRHVTVTGTFLDDLQTLVQAATELGAGYWVLTPLRTSDGTTVLVNRGFIPAEDRDRVKPADAAKTAQSTVTGLLRMPEPGGAFLRHNDAAANRWYSRDVQAIAAAHGLAHVAPYFIDAEAAHPSDARDVTSAQDVAPAPGTASAPSLASSLGAAVVPVGGLTVITFHNSHLVYAITWYTLALMVAGGIWLGVRSETRA